MDIFAFRQITGIIKLDMIIESPAGLYTSYKVYRKEIKYPTDVDGYLITTGALIAGDNEIEYTDSLNIKDGTVYYYSIYRVVGGVESFYLRDYCMGLEPDFTEPLRAIVDGFFSNELPITTNTNVRLFIDGMMEPIAGEMEALVRCMPKMLDIQKTDPKIFIHILKAFNWKLAPLLNLKENKEIAAQLLSYYYPNKGQREILEDFYELENLTPVRIWEWHKNVYEQFINQDGQENYVEEIIGTGVGNGVMTSSDGVNWTLRNLSSDNTWNSVTYGNGLFVAVAYSATSNGVITSPNGINWTLRTSVTNNDWTSVTYGDGLFVAVAYNGAGDGVMTSPDGITWTIRVSAANNSWNSVTYGNGLFVAVAYNATGNGVMTSPDGITWTLRTSVAPFTSWRSVTYGDGLFVAVGQSGGTDGVMTSSDGITWILRVSAAINNWNSVTYGDGLFVAVNDDGVADGVMISPDGITWTLRTSAVDNYWWSVTYGDGLFVAVSYDGIGNRVMTSPDGIIWTVRVSAADNDWWSVTYGDGLFVAVSNTNAGIFTSSFDFDILPYTVEIKYFDASGNLITVTDTPLSTTLGDLYETGVVLPVGTVSYEARTMAFLPSTAVGAEQQVWVFFKYDIITVDFEDDVTITRRGYHGDRILYAVAPTRTRDYSGLGAWIYFYLHAELGREVYFSDSSTHSYTFEDGEEDTYEATYMANLKFKSDRMLPVFGQQCFVFVDRIVAVVDVEDYIGNLPIEQEHLGMW